MYSHVRVGIIGITCIPHVCNSHMLSTEGPEYEYSGSEDEEEEMNDEEGEPRYDDTAFTLSATKVRL